MEERWAFGDCETVIILKKKMQTAAEVMQFTGTNSLAKDGECILLFDGEKIRIERYGWSMVLPLLLLLLLFWLFLLFSFLFLFLSFLSFLLFLFLFLFLLLLFS